MIPTAGYIKFRSQFVEGHEFDQPSSTMLVRIYSNLRRTGQRQMLVTSAP